MSESRDQWEANLEALRVKNLALQMACTPEEIEKGIRYILANG